MSILWRYKINLEKLFWIRKIDLVMTELAEDQRSGLEMKRVGEGIQISRGERRRKKMGRIRLAQWQGRSLCGAVFNMLGKGPVKCLSEMHGTFLSVIWTPPYQLAAENVIAMGACGSGGVCSSHA